MSVLKQPTFEYDTLFALKIQIIILVFYTNNSHLTWYFVLKYIVRRYSMKAIIYCAFLSHIAENLWLHLENKKCIDETDYVISEIGLMLIPNSRDVIIIFLSEMEKHPVF